MSVVQRLRCGACLAPIALGRALPDREKRSGAHVRRFAVAARRMLDAVLHAMARYKRCRPGVNERAAAVHPRPHAS